MKRDLCGFPQDVEQFLTGVSLPWITAEQCLELDDPLLLSEIREAIQSLANGMAPGPDGIPAECYKAYATLLAPMLLCSVRGILGAGVLTYYVMRDHVSLPS
ncbi:hypothetical protein NDU88_002663 [Pleurodeles waltl]|uniref:Uncharacterized protein n=1 Tax=Pleurodeles waltl TaxID=8319 RepID=A0AAV7W3Z5_PLEWA|nr:hypothetical protein NDU88_002663 [Pleurodeles waltl]